VLRKAHGITQAQLAEVLGVSQQTVQAYEVGRRRIQVAALPVVARTLNVSLEELFGENKQAARGKRGPASKLEHHLERIGSLPKPRQRAVIDVIEAMLAQQGH
jgi:transcriptional regulator with XRE-family HTH domain